ncbi:ATP-binding protein [Halomonas sp. BM-2019]|uniref:ATP-binding protein n=1 Tax=Halomonas sp. BM-2019 TaxID=2811227 RepID=UPI001B3C4761|nr:MAG: ATP-binding protein [Halomonas sp. BM-2019]
MHAIPHPLLAADSPPPLPVLLRIGLAQFWAQAMGADQGMAELLREQAGSDAEWSALCAQAARDWPPEPGRGGMPRPLCDFIREHRLSLPVAWLLALLGEAESDYLITLALGELQAPARSSRPPMHLLVALLEHLFGRDTPDTLDLAGSPLVEAGVIALDGDGPLPLQGARVEPALWSALCGRDAPWPGCRFVPESERSQLPLALRRQLPQLATLLARGELQGVVVRGNGGSGRRALAVELAALLGLRAIAVPREIWRERGAVALACRHARWLPVVEADVSAGETWQVGASNGTPLVIIAGAQGAVSGRAMLEIEACVPDEHERRELWARELDDPALTDDLATAALLGGPSIVQVARNARLRAMQAGEALDAEHVARARADLGAEGLRLLAQPVARRVGGDSVVFAPLVRQYLADLIARARKRESVWNGLGPTLQATRNAGLRTLFVGESGTGKTLAASYVATELGAPLYRVDLSSVMNKYIGESEKNLAALLDRAAAIDAVLLFDEADSLFGRRTDARQSGERYANMLTNFLLTAIELHPGIVILTTNNRERIDAAFTRRLDLIVDFPQPGFDERLELWRKHLGERSPDETVCRLFASYCDFSGGQIRNAVLNAAACAEADGPLATDVLLRAIEREFRKLGRALPPQLSRLGRTT